MTEGNSNNSLQEPAAVGREAFWTGRPIWANPFVGAVARAWKVGWMQGQAELASVAGEAALTASDAEQQRLLQLYRPADIRFLPGQQPRKSQSRVRRDRSHEPTYSSVMPDEEIASA